MRWPIRHCPDCGAAIEEPPVGNAQACSACGAIHYLNAKPCAGVLIERDRKVLLARRGGEPRKGTWDVVGGFMEPHEHPEETARREALEETGLRIRLKGLFAIHIDTYGDPHLYTLNLYFRAEAPQRKPVPKSDVTELRWFGPAEIPDDLAFPHEHDLLGSWKSVVRGETGARKT